MNLQKMRVGILLSPTSPLWTGTVVSYADTTFTLTVATVAGALAASQASLAIETSSGEWLRMKTINPGANTIELAENGNSDDAGYSFAAGETLSIYNVRIPFPRYQRITDEPLETGDASNQLSDWSVSGVTDLNSDEYDLYWEITAVAGGTQVALYWDAALTGLVASGSIAGAAGVVSLVEKNDTGISGTVLLTDPGGGPVPDDGKLEFGDIIVYKDYDITFTSLGLNPIDQSHAMQPPIAICYPAMVSCDTNEEVDFDASQSYATYNGWNGGARDPATITGYAWDAGTNGVVTAGAGTATPTIKWTSSGFRYIKLTVTDTEAATPTSVTQDRYIPVWVGITPYGHDGGVSKISYSQQLGKGGQLEVEIAMPPNHLRNALCAVVNLDTQEILFSGFIWPETFSYDFEHSKASFTVLSDLAFLQNVYSYPFRIEGVKGHPIDWNYFDMASIFRGCFYLLRWHSNYPEIANIHFGTVTGTTLDDYRLEYIRDFTAGVVLDQMNQITNSVHYGLYSNRISGLLGIPHWLYQSDITTAAADAVTLTLANIDMEEDVVKELAVRNASDVRYSGFYHTPAPDLDFFPVIVRGPTHPNSWGRPTEMAGMLATNTAVYSGYEEMLVWAGRHLAIENTSERFTITSRTDDLVLTDYQMVDLPTGERVVIEEQRIEYDAEGMNWKATLVGRTFGVTETSNVEDGPEMPEEPVDPPIIPPPPTPGYPEKVMAGTINNGVYTTLAFGGPDDPQPTWTDVSTGLGSREIVLIDVSPVDKTDQYCLTKNDGAGLNEYRLYYRSGTGNWTSILTQAQARVLAANGGPPVTTGDIVTFSANRTVDNKLIVLFWDGATGSTGLSWFMSVDNGSNWTFQVQSEATVALNRTPEVITDGDIVWVHFNSGALGACYFGRSPDNMTNLLTIVYTPIEYSAGPTWMFMPAGQTDVAYGPSNLWGEDIEKATFAGGVLTGAYLQDALNLGVTQPATMWAEPTDNNHQRLMKASCLYVTTDDWASVVSSTPSTISKAPTSFIVDDNTDMIILGAPAAAGQPHVILCMAEDTDTVPVDRAGLSPGVSPFTGSIPWKDPTGTVFNSICYHGIQILD